MAHVPMPSDAQCSVPLITVIATGRLQQRVQATWKARRILSADVQKGHPPRENSIAFGFPKHTISHLFGHGTYERGGYRSKVGDTINFEFSRKRL